MDFEGEDLDAMITEVERILRQNQKFGPLHRVESSDEGDIRLVWDNAALRSKSKAAPGPYLAFMEEIADCLSEFGYCLAADDESNEHQKNNFLHIVPDDDAEFEDD
jgi:hypothetical protein